MEQPSLAYVADKISTLVTARADELAQQQQEIEDIAALRLELERLRQNQSAQREAAKAARRPPAVGMELSRQRSTGTSDRSQSISREKSRAISVGRLYTRYHGRHGELTQRLESAEHAPSLAWEQNVGTLLLQESRVTGKWRPARRQELSDEDTLAKEQRSRAGVADGGQHRSPRRRRRRRQRRQSAGASVAERPFTPLGE